MNQALMAARTYAKSGFLAYGKNFRQLSDVIIELNDWNFNEMNGRFDIHFKASYKRYESGGLFGTSGVKNFSNDFNLKCDFNGENSTIKSYNDSSWTTLGSIS